MAVLVIVESADEALGCVGWGYQFARARDCALIVVHPAPAAGRAQVEDIDLCAAPADDAVAAANIARLHYSKPAKVRVITRLVSEAASTQPSSR